jgi:nitroreductase
MMPALAPFLAGLSSVRKFSSSEVDPALVRAAVGIAQRAPSASNHQPYSVIEVRSPEVRERLLGAMAVQGFCAAAPVFLVVCVDWSRQDLVAARVAGGNAMPREAKLVLGIADASIFAQQLALALQASGLGVCYVASPYTALGAVAAILECPPDEVMPLHILVAGHPAEQPLPRPRYPLDDIYHTDRYAPPAPQRVEAYLETADLSYQRENYGAVAEDGCRSIYEHYAVKYGAKALARTWRPLAADLPAFFSR